MNQSDTLKFEVIKVRILASPGVPVEQMADRFEDVMGEDGFDIVEVSEPEPSRSPYEKGKMQMYLTAVRKVETA